MDVIALGFIFAVAILGLYVLRKCGFECMVDTAGRTEMCAKNGNREHGDDKSPE